MTIGVFLVDDHALFRTGVKAELDRAGSAEPGVPPVVVVGEGGSVEEAVTGIAHLRPDVVLLDVHMPDGGGAEVLRRVRPEQPDVVFLALSVSDAAEDVIAVIRGGARGYVTKTISGRELVDAVRRVHAGDPVFSPRLAGFVLDAFAHRPGAAPVGDPELDLLTPRERDVLRKTQLSNRYELSRWASDRRLV
jgi:DNA-binding NarL/FixJ family response regulator